MKVLGLHIAAGQLRYSVLEGTKRAHRLVGKDRLVTIDPSNPPELMDWYESQFIQLLDQHEPDWI